MEERARSLAADEAPRSSFDVPRLGATAFRVLVRSWRPSLR